MYKNSEKMVENQELSQDEAFGISYRKRPYSDSDFIKFVPSFAKDKIFA
jgi:hypothetical protein